MKTYFGIFQPKRCQKCTIHKATRTCPKLKKEIGFHCCNEIRVQMACPPDCKYAIKSTHDQKNLQLNNYSESIAEQQELLDLYLAKWMKTENPLFDNKTPKAFAETDMGKKKIDDFLSKHEGKLKNALSYNFVREELGIPLKEKSSSTHEDIATRYLQLSKDLEYDTIFPMLLHHEIYKDEKFRKNYMRRNLELKAFKALKEFDLIRSALSKEQDQGIVEFEINGKYPLCVVLQKIDCSWFVKEKVFGESGMVLSESEFIQRVGYKYTQRDFSGAFSDLKKYSKVFPDSADLYYYFGIYYSAKGKVEKAKEAFFNAMELDPEFIEAKYNYAFLFQAEGKMDEARDIYEAILEQKEEPKTLNNLAVIYEQDERIDQAFVLLKKALELDKDFELAKKNLERINEKRTAASNPSEDN